MYVRAALLALALGHASAATNDEEANYDKFAVLRAPPNEDNFAVLRAVDDAQLLAEVARRNLVAPQDQRELTEGEPTQLYYSFNYECEPTPAPQVDVCDLCKTKDGKSTKCGKGDKGKFRLPGGTCELVHPDQRNWCDDGCLECGKHGAILNNDRPFYKCEYPGHRRLDGPAARPAWATGAPQDESSPMIPSWASQHRRLGEGKGSCYVPGGADQLPLCKPVGNCVEIKILRRVGKCGKKDKCGKLKCGKGYVTGSGKSDCVKSAGCSKCDSKHQVNYLQCGNCVDPQVVCAADEEDDCLKDEDACEDIIGATFCPSSKGGSTNKCGKLKCGKGYLIGSGDDLDCVEPDSKCPKCPGKEGQVNYLQCGTCVDKQEVCDADDE